MPETSILFVCMGNICRSPTAEAVFRAKAKEAGLLEQLTIHSAGTHAYHQGEGPDPRARMFASRRGFDLSAIRARQVKAADFMEFDFVLAMDKSNLTLLQAACPQQFQHKLGLFMDYARHFSEREVPDPYYGGSQGFETVLDYIEDASEGLIQKLRQNMLSAG
ncbi:low molecular weight protein-tyrosine-phosphatase [Undibacterium luofuense]|uniref:low molecular weight protein-tyrosine-phosphatase n=1 Tax=Undibacterium luofuense TaxID=2828733 RepID=UPI0030ECC0D1